ncbi:MAG: hypothetical protein JW863_13495 [Chitinispirillaceae bacterium]|nr:hypothetical protein [Chitinispirillaceae bacterium]
MKSHFFTQVCLLFICMAILASVPADKLISPDDPCFNYYGRFDMSNPKAPKFNWSGVVIEASVPGPIVGMSMKDGNNDYDIEIDGKRDKIIRTQSSVQQYMFRTDLTSDMHTVRIIQRSENHWGTATFRGLYLADGKVPGPAPKKPQRKIEFIGDSYTAGYGIESPSQSCNSTQLRQYTNTNLTFASLVTKAFHAQSSILAWSGQGMVRNYGDKNKRSSTPYPFYYDRILGAASTAAWNYPQWKADLVVINLGTNDFSTQPNPDESMYVGDYHNFIKRVLGNYPDAAIICVSTSQGVFENYIKKVVTEETTTLNHPGVYSAAYPSSRQNSGCDYHPSITDNRNVANILIHTSMTKMNWDTTEAPVEALPSVSNKRPQPDLFVIHKSGDQIRISQSESVHDQTEFSLMNLQGKIVLKQKSAIDGICTIQTKAFTPGLYLAGSIHLGWVPVVIKK